MKGRHREYKLKKELTLFNTVLLGIGIILGAGIYALIGVGAGIAGNMLWLSFVIAGIIAIFTGLSYAELSSVFTKEAAEYNYTKRAFGREWLSFIVGWVLVAAGVISAATVAIGFAGYFTHIFGGSVNVVAAVLVIVLSFLNYGGIKNSARFNNMASIIEILGLLLVIILGVVFFGNSSNTNFFQMPEIGFAGIFSAVAVIFFAYIGFEGIVNLSEEVKNAKKIVPKALVISLVISTVLYILVSISAIGMVGADKLASSKAPLTEAVAHAFPGAGLLMSIIALFATGNTVLIIMIVTSRIFYGISNQHSLPSACSIVGRTGTPYISVILIGIVTTVFAFLGDLKLVASMTDLAIFIAYFFVNLALIKLRYTKGFFSHFRGPSIGRFPVLAFLGLITSFLMFLYFDFFVWLITLGIIGLGLLIFGLVKLVQYLTKKSF